MPSLAKMASAVQLGLDVSAECNLHATLQRVPSKPLKSMLCMELAGSRDTTLIIWDAFPWPQRGRASGVLPLDPAPRRVLYGHDDAVTCLAVCPELDLVLSGSADGAVLFHTLGEGR